jgi:cytochrome c1
MYILQNDIENNLAGIFCDINKHSIPLDPANSDYQKVLDDIIEQGADCFTGDIPTDLQTAADAKQFAQQVEAYKEAKARVAQYQLSVGVPESSETIVTGQEMNMETGEMQDVTETIVTPAIDALEATVEVTTYDFDTDTSTTATVANPVIVKDNEERAAAQAIIDATPVPVKTHVDG